MPFPWTINPYRGCSHSCVYCFSRRTHEWLEFDSGNDFNSQIVVKTNLVEVLRRNWQGRPGGASTSPSGTNTDPYQRAEGRYRLMPGVIGALADRARPSRSSPRARCSAATSRCSWRRRSRFRSGSGSRWRSGTTTCTPPSSQACRRRGHASTWSRRSPNRAAVRRVPRAGAARADRRHGRAGRRARGYRRGRSHRRHGHPAAPAPRGPRVVHGLATRSTPSSSRGTSSSTPDAPTYLPSTAPGCSNGSRRCCASTAWTGSPVAPPEERGRSPPASRATRRWGSRRAACRPGVCRACPGADAPAPVCDRRRPRSRSSSPCSDAAQPARRDERCDGASRPHHAARRDRRSAGGQREATVGVVGEVPVGQGQLLDLLPARGRHGGPQVLRRPDGVLGEGDLQRLVGQPATDA